MVHHARCLSVAHLARCGEGLIFACTMLKDFDRLIARFRQFGGWRLVWQYARMGVLCTGVKELARYILHGRSVKAVYPVITQKVDALLMEQYKEVLEDGLQKYNFGGENTNKKPKVLWTTWLQGEDKAPELMKVCWNSWRQHLSDYKLRIITMENLSQWAVLPDWFVEKYRRGIIPPALFSDVMRLDLLVRHGGTWIDGTVLCTGFPTERLQKKWAEIEASELCLFRYYQRGRKDPVGMSTWFISARQVNTALATARDMMLAYWRDYNCTVDYYLPHLCIGVALNRMPALVAAIPRCNSTHSVMLGASLGKDFDEAAWKDLTDHVSFHKLNFRKADEAARNPKSYYNFIVKNER